MTEKYQFDNIYGMVIGLLLGDSLALPHNGYRKIIFKGKLEYTITFYNKKSGIKEIYPIGKISDVSELNILLLNYLLENNLKYNREEIILEYVKWTNNHSTRFQDLITKRLFNKEIKNKDDFRDNFRKVFKIPENKHKSYLTYNAVSNSCLKRSIFLSFLPNIDIIRDSYLTNPNYDCKEITLTYVKALRMAYSNKSKDDIYLKCHRNCPIHFVRQIIDEAYDGTIKRVTRNKDWIGHTIYCIFYAFFNYINYSTGIEWVILQGGDTKTNAALAGALLGAFYGYEHIQKDNQDNIEKLLNSKTERPEEYTLLNIKEKIQKLVKTLNEVSNQ